MRSPVVSPWVRTRLRAAPGAASALALLVSVTAFLAAAFPLALDHYADSGLRTAVLQAEPDRTTVQLAVPPPEGDLTQEQVERSLLPGPLAEHQERLLGLVRRPLVTDRRQSSYGVITAEAQEVPDPWLPRPNGLPARMVLAAQQGLADHSRVTAGRLPRTDGPVTAATAEVEAAVSAATARSLDIRVGSLIHVPATGRDPLVVRVTGIVTPREPSAAWWSTQTLLRTPQLIRRPGSVLEQSKYWRAALLLAPEAAPALLATEGRPFRYWQLAPDPDALHGHDLGSLTSAVAALESGPALERARAAIDPRLQAGSELDEVLASYGRLRSGISPLVAVAASGAGTVAAVVLLLAGGLATDRRRAELALLRARGASLRGLTARLLGETAVVAVPAGALGLAAALLAVPDGRPLPAVLAALAVTLAGCAALPLRAAAAHHRVRVHTGREDVVSVRPSRRRTVAELTLVAVAAGAVETLRRRGTGAGGGDQLVSLAPVLVGVIAALVLVRLHPFPLRGLARPAARLRGLVAPLSLARAGRTAASATLPLLALLTALTTAAFGGSVLAGVHEARERAATLAVGADARVESLAALPPGVADKVRETPGVRAVAEAAIHYQANPSDGRIFLPLAGVDPAGYAELSARTGLGPFPEGALKSPRGTPLPAVASPSVADTYGTAPFPVRLDGGTTVEVRIVLVRDRTPAIVGEEFLVVDRAGLGERAARPTALLLTGTGLDRAALTKAAGPAPAVQLRTAVRAGYVDSPLQSGAERLYAAAVVAGSAYAVLALLLTLLRTAPERTALLARLRTMGLTRAQGRRLLVLESLPQAALAAVGGTLTGWATIRLLGPGVDLSTLALPASPATLNTSPLRTDALSLTVPAVSVLAVTVGVAAVQAWWAGRRGAVRELRVGDAR